MTRPFEDLQETGLLWLVNTTTFHPRGYALALVYGDDGALEGWTIVGDGTQAWMFDKDDPDIDRCFDAVSELLPSPTGQSITKMIG